MESSTGKESIVSRLFGFGRRRPEEEKAKPAPLAEPEEKGFARADEADGEATVTASEQVIRIRAEAVGRKDEAIQAIGDSFRELTSMLSSVSDRLDRQDSHSASLVDQFQDLPEYLRKLPQLHEQQAEALQAMASSITRLPEAQEEQARATHAVSERLAEGTDAIHGLRESLSRIPEEMRERTASQEAAIRKVAAAQQQTAKVLHVGHQKSLQLFHQAVQKVLQQSQKTTRMQQRHMEEVLYSSQANMKRVILLAAAFMGAALAAVVALLWMS
ncbi:MAG: hypothetical protein ACYTGV_12820 [Planctomycetota bacterium]|jgi:uncharacterized phage infection (PIP) family protein YhgE